MIEKKDIDIKKLAEKVMELLHEEKKEDKEKHRKPTPGARKPTPPKSMPEMKKPMPKGYPKGVRGSR